MVLECCSFNGAGRVLLEWRGRGDLVTVLEVCFLMAAEGVILECCWRGNFGVLLDGVILECCWRGNFGVLLDGVILECCWRGDLGMLLEG